MSSRRASSHFVYDKYFRPLIAALEEKGSAGAPQVVSAMLTKSRALETKSRFYVWRKLLSEHIRGTLGAKDEDYKALDTAMSVSTRMVPVEGAEPAETPGAQPVELVFYIDNGEEFLTAFGLAGSSEDAAATAAIVKPRVCVPQAPEIGAAMELACAGATEEEKKAAVVEAMAQRASANEQGEEFMRRYLQAAGASVSEQAREERLTEDRKALSAG